jgi:hypothetical protein
MKKIALILGLFLCLSFVAAKPIMDPATPQYNTGQNSPNQNAPIINWDKEKGNSEIVSGTQTQESDSGSGSLLTKWVWNGKECVKADILSVPFTIGARSTYMYPYVVVKTNSDGSRVIRRILPGRIGVAFNSETMSVEPNPNCDTSQINVAPLEPNWFRR